MKGIYETYAASSFSVIVVSMKPDPGSHLTHGQTYSIRTRRGAFLAAVEGPFRDGNAECYIVCGPDGDFDIEYDGHGSWDAGSAIGPVQVREI